MRAGLVNRGPDLRKAFHGWILATGSALVTDQEKDGTLIDTLLKLKVALHEMLDGPFQHAATFTDVRNHPTRRTRLPFRFVRRAVLPVNLSSLGRACSCRRRATDRPCSARWYRVSMVSRPALACCASRHIFAGGAAELPVELQQHGLSCIMPRIAWSTACSGIGSARLLPAGSMHAELCSVVMAQLRPSVTPQLCRILACWSAAKTHI